MNDYIIRGTAANDQVRFLLHIQKMSWRQQDRNIIQVGSNSSGLGRLLTAGAMMGSMCKNDSDVITYRFSAVDRSVG